jgi:hypothetical protein
MINTRGKFIMSAKKVNAISIKGLLDTDAATIKSETKDGIFIYDLRKVLNEFSGYEITLSIKQEDGIEELLVDEE